MADINVEMLKDKLYTVAKALFMISETLVDESKLHISKEDALVKICSYMHDADIICSRYRIDKLIEDCMEPVIDDCCMASNIDRMAFVANKDFLDKVSKMNSSDIDASVERIKKYIKE